MGRIRSALGAHRALTTTAVVVAVGLMVFVLYWFQPQKLFIETTVNESAPAETPTASAAPRQREIASGRFRSLEHETTGGVSLIRLASGEHVLRFDDLDTSNGPDLRVYLSELPSTLGDHDYGKRFIDLGALKGNRGSQNYRIAAGTDVAKYRSAVIWCRRFSVGFAVAPLRAA